MARADVVTAARELAVTLETQPDDLPLRRDVLLLQLAAGDVDAATVNAEALVAVDPASPDAQLTLAVAAIRRGDWAVARDHMAAVPDPTAIGIMRPVLDAWCRWGAGDRTEALAALADRGSRGIEPLRRYHHAVMLGLLGRPAEGARELASMLGGEDEPPSRMTVTLSALDHAAGGASTALERLDRDSVNEGDDALVDAARDDLRAGRAPRSPIRDAVTGFADALLGLAEAIRQQDPLRAAGLTRLAIALSPGDGDAYLLVAGVFDDLDNPTEVVRILESAPREGPLAWRAELTRADALLALDREAEAETLLRNLAEARPERAEAVIALADLLRREERFAEAVQAYDGALARIAATGQPSPWRLLYGRGIAHERSGNWPAAEADFLAALEARPDQPMVLNYLGYSWVDRGENLEAAKAMLHRAVELQPQDGYIVDSLGWAYYRVADYPSAVLHLERAVELQPADPVLNDHLGDAYWRAGREREARFQWQRVLAFEPDQQLARTVRGKLENGLAPVQNGG